METRSVGAWSVWYRNRFTGEGAVWRLYAGGLKERAAHALAAKLARDGWGSTEVRAS